MIDLAAIVNARNDPSFGQEVWITFYLVGDPDGHASMAPSLVALNAVNLGGAEGGFVYAKVPASLNEAEIQERIAQVRALADKSEIEIAVIDLDAATDVERSKFYTLWTPPTG